MGVSWVLEAREGEESVELVTRRLRDAGARHVGSFAVQLTCHRPKKDSSLDKLLYIVTHSTYPTSAFELVCTENRTGQTITHEIVTKESASSDIQHSTLIERMAPIFQPTQKYSITGKEWQLHDAVYRVGVVTQGAQVRTTTVEIDYGPVAYASMCTNLMLELAAVALPTSGTPHTPPMHIQKMRRSECFTGLDTAAQYLHVIQSQRSTAQGKQSRQ